MLNKFQARPKPSAKATGFTPTPVRRPAKGASSDIKSELGFTLIELLVVISIMVILSSAMVINLAGQRAARDIKIAQSQLISNIRKTQSYTLSSRNLPSGEAVQYYIVKFDLSKPSQYTIQAYYNIDSSPTLRDIETIILPANIRLALASPVVVDRSLTNDTVDSTSGTPYLQTPTVCGLVAFAAPFGKVIFNDGCSTSGPDDYYSNILSFQNNTPCQSYNPASPTICRASSDTIMTITLTDLANSVSKTVTVNGITGAVSFN